MSGSCELSSQCLTHRKHSVNVLILLTLRLVMISLYFLGSSVFHVNEGLNKDNHLFLIDLDLHFPFVCITDNHSQN